MELGNHAEFLGVMTANEMLSMFFHSRWRRDAEVETQGTRSG